MTAPHDDADLAALREAVAARTADRELSVARSWGTVVARRAGVERPPRPRRLRALVPVTAAATVAAVALGMVTLLGPRWDGLGFLTADPGSPSDTESYRPNLDPPSEQAVAALRALAEAAEQSEPVSVRAGQVVYVRSEGWAVGYRRTQGGRFTGTVHRQDWQGWFHPVGMEALRLTRNGEVRRGGGAGDPEDFDKPLEAEPAGRPYAGPTASPTSGPAPGPFAPTPAWLAGLSTDPDQLRADLRAWLKDGETWSTDHAVWEAMSVLYSTAEILIPPEVRAALLRAFTGLHGLTMVEADIDGQRLIGIRRIEQNYGFEILFDPETGRAVGHRSVSTADLNLAVPEHRGLDVRKVMASVEQGITHQGLWTQRLVDEVGDTG